MSDLIDKKKNKVKKMRKVRKVDLIEAYTDGSLRRESTGDVCGYGIYFPNKKLGLNNVKAPFTIEPITNNRAELYAIYRTIKRVRKKYDFDKLIIYSDSEYSVKSTTEWIVGWKKRNWKNSKRKPVENQDIIKKIDKLLTEHSGKIDIKWVRAHEGLKGNEEADRLANEGADLYRSMFVNCAR